MIALEDAKSLTDLPPKKGPEVWEWGLNPPVRDLPTWEPRINRSKALLPLQGHLSALFLLTALSLYLAMGKASAHGSQRILSWNTPAHQQL